MIEFIPRAKVTIKKTLVCILKNGDVGWGMQEGNGQSRSRR